MEYNPRAAQHAFLAGKGDVRGQDDVGRVQQGLAVVQRRLAIIYIHRRASQMAAAQRVAQRLRIHQRAAGAVDKQRAGLHLGKLSFADHFMRLRAGGRMQGNDVAAFQHLAQRGILHAQLARLLHGLGIIGHHPRAEGQHQPRHAQPDAPQSHDAHRALGNLAADQPRAALMRAHRGVAIRQPAQQCNGHAYRQLGHALIGIVGRVAHQHAARAASLHGHMIHARKGHVDVLERGIFRHRLGGKGRVGDDHRVHALRAADHLLWGIRLGIIYGQLMPALQHGRGHLPQHFFAYVQGLKQRDFHE